MQTAVSIALIILGILALLILLWLAWGVVQYNIHKKAIKDANERGFSDLSPIMAILMWPLIPLVWTE